MPAHKKHTVQFRIQFLKAETNKTVSDVCREFNISRKTYYKWKAVFEKEGHTENKARGRKKRVDDRLEKIIKDLIILNPEWNLDKLYNYLKESNGGDQLVSRYWIQTLLQKSKLSNKIERYKFSHLHLPQPLPIVTNSNYLQTEDIVQEKQIVLNQSDSSPPRTLLTQTLKHYKPVLLTVIVALLNSYLVSRVIYTIFSAQGISQKIGMALSSLALFCGIFFFLYSLKYYITIVSVIIKARNIKKDTQSIMGDFFNSIKNRFIKNAEFKVETDPISLHKKVQETTLERYPFFSVQIALYNEKRVAERVVRAALAMDYPNFEVLVCDDSTDETTQILREKFGDNPRVKIVHRANRAGFKGAALGNALGYMDPKTDYVVVFDSDFVPYPDTLSLFAKYYQVIGNLENKTITEFENSSSLSQLTDNQVSNSYSHNIINQLPSQQVSKKYVGKTVAIQGYQWHVLNKSENWITRAVRAEFAGSYIIERSGGQVFGLLKQIAGSVYSINATVLKEVGWGTSITEDFQLTLKLYERGYKVGYTPYIQSPSECVSTLKRLIRQRQRWAEGHSFNIKKHIRELLTSDKLTAKEKWEAIYLTPYYLQAFVFVIGTVCWIIAESVLNVKLPFWTAALGWSLVLTNLFSLPLMNTIGLFMEEGEERDYLGIFSFITLCYILAPFIGFAALKGFIEKEEGPWFRTPKSGHITDNVKRGGLNTNKEKISKLLPWLSPALSKILGIIPQQDITSPYLAFTTAGNSFNSERGINNRSRVKKRLTHLLVIVLFAMTIVTNVLQTSVPQAFANPDTYYARATTDSLAADNITSTSTALRTALSTTAGASTQTYTVDSTNTTFYVLSDNLNKRWTSDTKINDSNTTGDRRNVAVATENDGDTVAVWEDSRNTTSPQNQFQANATFMASQRANAAVTTLLDGRVLIAGGNSASSTAVSTVELYDPVSSTFAAVSSGFLPGVKQHAVAVTLDDGRALVIGGVSGAMATGVTTVSIYDPNTNAVSTTNGMNIARMLFAATKLNNGKVLVTGGCTNFDTLNGVCTTGLSTSELFDPGTGTWTLTTGGMTAVRSNVSTVLLPNGEVLAANGARSVSEIFNPVTGSWRKTSPANRTGISGLRSGLIRVNDKILSAGGGTTVSELFDPASQTWTLVDSLPASVAYASSLTQLGNGKILAVGGQETSDLSPNGSSTAALYDPLTSTWSLTSGNLPELKSGITPVLLNNGKVLIAGGGALGETYYSSAALYTPVTYDIYAQKYDKTGAKQWNSGTDIRVNTDDGNRVSSSGPPNYNHLNPSVSLDSSGNAIVAWEEQRDGVFSSTIWSQKLQESDGSKLWPTGTRDTFSKAPGVLSFVRTASNKEGAMITPLNNGKVLISGTDSSNNGRSTAEVYDPIARAFSNVKMSQQRYDHTATPLLNGKVLLAGSRVSLGTSSTAELYDPALNTFTPTTGFIAGGRAGSMGVLLKNGKVALIGGENGSSTTLTSISIYDPATDTFSSGPGTARTHNNAAAITLPNGKVLIVGDSQGGAGVTAAELFDPLTNTVSNVPGAHTNRGWNGLALLNNGKVLSVGLQTGTSTAVDLYDPVLNTWTSGGNMILPKSNSNMVLMPSGKVLQVGGWDQNSNSPTNETEAYNPATNTWATADSPALVAPYMAQVFLPATNKIFVTKGLDTAATTTAELYIPTADIQVSTYDYKYNEAYARTNNGSIDGIFYKKPKITNDSNGDMVVVWQDNKNAKSELQNKSYSFDANGRYSFGKNPAPVGQMTTTGSPGNVPTILSPPVQVVSQKICNRASCGDAGTTSGERQWGNDQNIYNKNNPEERFISNINNSQNVNVVNDGTNVVVTYNSDSGSSAQESKTNKIYAQKLDTDGKIVWSGGWSTNATNLSSARQKHTATLLNEGKILITGGSNGSATLSTAEIYDPLRGTYSVISSRLPTGKQLHSATLLNTGNILIAGGDNSGAVTTASVYSASGITFSNTTGGLVTARYAHSATPLRNGKVVIAGGVGSSATLSAAELYDLSGNSFADTGFLTRGIRSNHQTVALPSGEALIAGGTDSTNKLSTAEKYDPANATWTTAGNMTTARDNFVLIGLNNGKVLAVGGTDGTNRLSSAEIYDPLTNSWTATGFLSLGVREKLTAALLPSGLVLIQGGFNGSSGLSTTEVYDPATGTFSVGSHSTISRSMTRTVSVANGKIINFGGNSSDDAAGQNTSAKTAGTNSGTNWTGTGNTASSDNSYATYNNTAQNYLNLTNFGFTSGDIPSGATINGITITREGNADATGGASSSGPRSPTAGTDCTNQTGTGTVAWSTPTNCATSNNSRATASLDGTTSNWLQAVNFGFSIPTGATINGITVEAERNASSTSNGGIDDANIRIVKGGVIGATNATLLTDWATTDGYALYGSSSSLWGESWSASDINASTFGFAMSATKASGTGAAITASVDHIRITVNYTESVKNTYNICLTKDGSTCTGTEKTDQTLPLTTDDSQSVGGAADLWGTTWSDTDLTSSNFGVRIKDANTDASGLDFDYVGVAVNYTAGASGSTLSTSEIYTIEQKVSTADTTSSQNPDLIKDSEGNFQIVWQAWRGEGLAQGTGGGSWKVMSQEIDNPTSGSVTKQYPTSGTNTWAAAGNLMTSRRDHATALLPNGKVMVSGGTDTSVSHSSAEIYDPQTQTWSQAGTMINHHAGHAMVTLRTGKVIAFAGYNSGVNKTDVYDPDTNTWTAPASGNLISGRSEFGTATLNDGKILIVGGQDGSDTAIRTTSEIYDPSTQTWTLTTGGLTTARQYASITKANNGKVYAIGGCNDATLCFSSSVINTIEVYEPATQSWSALSATLSTARYKHNATLLSNGKILINGGANSSNTNLSTSEIFDPMTETVSSAATAPFTSLRGNTPLPYTTLLNNGKVLLVRGAASSSTSTQAMLYNPELNSWTSSGSLSKGYYAAGIVGMKSGKVIIIAGADGGGGTGYSSSEIYTPEVTEQLVSTDDSTVNYNQVEPKIASDSASAYSYVAWNDERLTSRSDTTIDKNIYMQKLDGNGSPAWPNGLGQSGTYDVRDVRLNNIRGSLDTSAQNGVAIAKTVFTNTASDKPIQVAWNDTRDGSPSMSIYGQSYNVMDYSMTSTTWTATFYTNAVAGTNQMDIQVGAMEVDGESPYFLSTTGTFAGDNVSGVHTMNFNTLPPSGEASLTHKRFVLKFTHNTGTGIQISYNGTAGVADTKLDVGTVVPERSALLALILPFLPILVQAHRRRYIKRIGSLVTSR